MSKLLTDEVCCLREKAWEKLTLMKGYHTECGDGVRGDQNEILELHSEQTLRHSDNSLAKNSKGITIYVRSKRMSNSILDDGKAIETIRFSQEKAMSCQILSTVTGN